MHDQPLHDLGPSEQAAEAARSLAVEWSTAQRRRGECRFEVVLDVRQHGRLERLSDHTPTIEAERCGAPFDQRLHADTCSAERSEEHTSELQSLMRISYAVFCLKKKHKST